MNAADTLLRIHGIWPQVPRPLGHKAPFEIPGVDRNDLATLFYELGFKEGAEIGVEQGAYSEVLLTRNPGLRLYGVDPWQAYKGYREHVSQSKLDSFYHSTLKRLSVYDFIPIRLYSVGAQYCFEDHPLDFVYIDANHSLEHVIEDISLWEKVVRPGGIIAGHDYCKRVHNGYQVHVVEAVQAYTQAYQISPWFVLGSKEVREGERRDRPRSWMWVKE